MRLHLDHNQIEFIHPNAFNGLISLRLLHLEGNLLQQLHPNTFSTFLVLDYFRMSTIKHLYLSENAIRTLPKGIFERMPLLENIYLHGNPWSCDCRLNWFLEWTEKSAGKRNFVTNGCRKSPSDVIGQKILSGYRHCTGCSQFMVILLMIVWSYNMLGKSDLQTWSYQHCIIPIIKWSATSSYLWQLQHFAFTHNHDFQPSQCPPTSQEASCLRTI